MVMRRVPREQFYLHTSVVVPLEAPSFIATMQPLQGLQLPAHQQFLTLRPSLTWRTQRDRPSDAPAQRSSSLDPTLDLKWRPRPELVIDATLNPDFSQVALDVPIDFLEDCRDVPCDEQTTCVTGKRCVSKQIVANDCAPPRTCELTLVREAPPRDAAADGDGPPGPPSGPPLRWPQLNGN